MFVVTKIIKKNSGCYFAEIANRVSGRPDSSMLRTESLYGKEGLCYQELREALLSDFGIRLPQVKELVPTGTMEDGNVILSVPEKAAARAKKSGMATGIR